MTDTTDPAERLQALLRDWEEVLAHYVGTRHEATVPVIIADFIAQNVTAESMAEAARDLRAVLAELDELRDFVPPKCTRCGERCRNGHYTENDDTWLCATCHIQLAGGAR
jgi:hypothetical protein